MLHGFIFVAFFQYQTTSKIDKNSSENMEGT